MIDKTEYFIERANLVHGKKYGYDRATYTRNSDKTTITCLEHGDFIQTPANHLRGQGCPECAKKVRADKKRLSFSDVVDRANKIHDNKYEYPEQGLLNGNRTKIDIICPIHGVFNQVVSSHLSGVGCPKCAGNIQKTKEEFIADSRKVHGDEYDYTNSEYISAFKPVNIKCKIHGVFTQTPDNHINGKQGCPFCGSAGTYNKRYFIDNPHLKDIRGIIYVVEFILGEERFIKVGITKKTSKKRWTGVKSGSYSTTILLEKETTLYNAWETEQMILSKYKNMRYEPLEKFSGHTESIMYSYKDRVLKDFNEAMIYRNLM